MPEIIKLRKHNLDEFKLLIGPAEKKTPEDPVEQAKREILELVARCGNKLSIWQAHDQPVRQQPVLERVIALEQLLEEGALELFANRSMVRRPRKAKGGNGDLHKN
jgi:hypothetical protein